MSDAQRAWIKRVLGVDVGQPLGTSASPQDSSAVLKARKDWYQAVVAVEKQLNALAQVMVKTNDDGLEDVADGGLNEITDTYKVPVMDALRGLDPPTPEAIAKNGPALVALAKTLRAQIQKDERVLACEDNPDSVPVAIRSTLVPVLTALEEALTPT